MEEKKKVVLLYMAPFIISLVKEYFSSSTIYY